MNAELTINRRPSKPGFADLRDKMPGDLWLKILMNFIAPRCTGLGFEYVETIADLKRFGSPYYEGLELPFSPLTRLPYPNYSPRDQHVRDIQIFELNKESLRFIAEIPFESLTETADYELGCSILFYRDTDILASPHDWGTLHFSELDAHEIEALKSLDDRIKTNLVIA